MTEGVSLFFPFMGDLLTEQGHDTVMMPCTRTASPHTAAKSLAAPFVVRLSPYPKEKHSDSGPLSRSWKAFQGQGLLALKHDSSAVVSVCAP